MAKKVTLVYFSSTKTTKKNLLAMAEGMGCPFETVDFTLPASRERDVCFGKDDFVIFGSPVYGGVMPLLVREYLEKHINGNNTPCAIVAVYGNRHFDDCLVEMEDLLTEKGFLVTAAAAWANIPILLRSRQDVQMKLTLHGQKNLDRSFRKS